MISSEMISNPGISLLRMSEMISIEMISNPVISLLRRIEMISIEMISIEMISIEMISNPVIISSGGLMTSIEIILKFIISLLWRSVLEIIEMK
jgi:hypothetical protein